MADARSRAPRPAGARGDAESNSSKALAKQLHATLASSVALGPNGKHEQQVGAKGRERDGMPALNASPIPGAHASDRQKVSRASSLVKETIHRYADKRGQAESNAAAGGNSKDKRPVRKGKPATKASAEPDPRLKKVLKSVLKAEIERVFGESLNAKAAPKAYNDVQVKVYKKVLQSAQGWDAEDFAALNEHELREQVTMLTRTTCKILQRRTHQPAPQSVS